MWAPSLKLVFLGLVAVPSILLVILSSRYLTLMEPNRRSIISLRSHAAKGRWRRYLEPPVLPLRYSSIPSACESNSKFYSSPLFCHSVKKPLLMVLILSNVVNFKQRQEVRTRWMRSRFHMKPDFIKAHPWTYTFVVGHPTGIRAALVKKSVEVEKCLYKDILDVNVMENYHNLTWKKMEALQYLIKSGVEFDVLLKTDDDIYINMQLILEWLPDAMSQASERRNSSDGLLYGGRCRSTYSPIRDPSSRWYLSPQDYAPSRLPPFCFGAAYFLSKDLIKAMLKLPDLKKSFKLEDVHTGLLVNETNLVPADNMVQSSRIYCDTIGVCCEDLQYPFAAAAGTSTLRVKLWSSFMRNSSCK